MEINKYKFAGRVWTFGYDKTDNYGTGKKYDYKYNSIQLENEAGEQIEVRFKKFNKDCEKFCWIKTGLAELSLTLKMFDDVA